MLYPGSHRAFTGTAALLSSYALPEANIHKFHKDFDESFLGLVEPFTIGVEVNRRGQITKGDKVLIMGSGPIGIAAMQVAKRNGAEVIMTDLVKERLDKALSMVADEVVLVSENTGGTSPEIHRRRRNPGDRRHCMHPLLL